MGDDKEGFNPSVVFIVRPIFDRGTWEDHHPFQVLCEELAIQRSNDHDKCTLFCYQVLVTWVDGLFAHMYEKDEKDEKTEEPEKFEISARLCRAVAAERIRNVGLLALAIILMSAGAAGAQSSNGSSSNYFPSLLGSLLPRLGSSGGGIFPIGSGYIPYAAPGYLPFGLRNSLYRPSNYRGNSFNSPQTQQSVGYASTGSFTTPKSMTQETYTDPEPLLGPRQRTRPFRTQYQPTDQIAHAGWPNQSPNQSQSQPDLGPRAMSSQSAPPHVGSNHAPFTAPDASGFSSTASGVSANSNPHQADNFIKTVNSKFNGDISQALFDPQTRGLAKSVGLTDDDALFDANLSKSRVGIVRNIFNDPSLSSASKINAVKILLHDEAK